MAPTSAQSWWKPAAPAVLLAALGVWIYWPALRGGWIWDDYMYVADNAALRSWGGLRSIWFTPQGVNYFPVTFTVQWAQWHLWGEAPLGYHLTNLALHLLNCCLLGRAVQWLAERRDPACGRAAQWAGWTAALLFAVHPLAVESVAWICELKNTLSLALVLAATLAYLQWDRAEARPRLWYVVSLLAFLLAMLSKSTVAMFPACIILLAWWRRGRIASKDLLASVPFALVALTLGLITVWFEHHRTMAVAMGTQEPLMMRIAAAGLAMVFYLGKSLLPLGLMPNYPRWTAGGPTLALGWLAWAAAAAFSYWLWTRRSRWGRGAFAAWGLFALNLAPILGLIPMAYLRISFVADHFAYLSLAVVAGAAGAAIGRCQCLSAAPANGQIADPAHALRRRFFASCPFVPIGGAVILAAVLAAASRGYAGIYRSEDTFWSFAAATNPRSWTAQSNLALILAKQGRTAEALARYETELRINPQDAGGHSNLATLLAADPARRQDAIAEYEAALRLKSDLPGVEKTLADLLAGQPGRQAEAIAHYENSLRSSPSSAAAQNNLAGLLFRLPGRQADAAAHYEAALRLEPDFAEAHANLGLLFSRQPGRQAEAIAQYQAALRLQPDAFMVHFYLGCELAKNSGRAREAAEQFTAAARLNPDFLPARQALQALAAGR